MVIMLIDKLLRILVIFDKDGILHLDTNQTFASFVALLDNLLWINLLDVLLKPLPNNNRMIILYEMVHNRQDMIGIVIKDILGRNVFLLVLAVVTFHIVHHASEILNVVQRSPLVFEHFFHLVFLADLVERGAIFLIDGQRRMVEIICYRLFFFSPWLILHVRLKSNELDQLFLHLLLLGVALTQKLEGIFDGAEEITVYYQVAILALLNKFNFF